MPESSEKTGNDAAEIAQDDYCKLTAWAAQQAGRLEWLHDSNPYKAGVTTAIAPCHPARGDDGAGTAGD